MDKKKENDEHIGMFSELKNGEGGGKLSFREDFVLRSEIVANAESSGFS